MGIKRSIGLFLAFFSVFFLLVFPSSCNVTQICVRHLLSWNRKDRMLFPSLCVIHFVVIHFVVIHFVVIHSVISLCHGNLYYRLISKDPHSPERTFTYESARRG
jgi:hypothetical protein